VTTRRIHRKSSISELLHEGPWVEVSIGLAQSYAMQLARDGQSVRRPISGRALIDTGASITCIDDTLAQSLGLPVIDVVGMISASDVTTVNVYPIQMEIIGLGKVYVSAMGANLKPNGITVLIGRDYFQHCVLSYKGVSGEFTLSLWDASISLSGHRIKRN